MEAGSSPPAVPPLEQWLWPFLRTEYYKCCPTHEQMNNKNSRCNFFCIHCAGPICEYCRNSQLHRGHHIFQIRRASKACSVDTESIACFMDTSGLHKFKINGYSIHFLVRRFSEGSKKKAPTSDDSLCDSCRWTLPGGVALGSRFCSIYCKVTELLYDSSSNSLLVAVRGESRRRIIVKSPRRPCADVLDRPSCEAQNNSRQSTDVGFDVCCHGKRRSCVEVRRDVWFGPQATLDEPALKKINEEEKEKTGEHEESKINGAAVSGDRTPAPGHDVCSCVSSGRFRRRKGVPHRSAEFAIPQERKFWFFPW